MIKKISNAKYVDASHSLIDVEIELSESVVIPYTLNTITPDESLDAEIRELLVDFEIEAYTEPEKTTEELLALYTSYYKEVLNKVLKEKDYEIEKLGWYAANPNSIYNAEALSIIEWNEELVNINYAILNKVAENKKYNESWVSVIPTKEEYLAELPSFTLEEV